MSSKSLLIARRVVPWLALALTAIALAGCGSSVQVQPAASPTSSKLVSRGRVDSPETNMRNYLGCLTGGHLPVQVTSPTRLEVGPGPAGATIVFAATPGAAEADQIDGSVQGAEVIGSALVYPNQAPEPTLGVIEACLAQGVQG
jgi:hypothetical protein